MSIRFYNTLSRKEEDFQAVDSASRLVRLYCCGPTVYHFAHIGNFRTFIFEDLLRRFLEARGFTVKHVMNITDVEDKIIRSVSESGEALTSFTRKYEQAFLEDLTTLQCLPPHLIPRATEHIPEIIDLIQKLITRGVAYATEDGSVYFSIERFPSYGKLSHLDRSQLKPGARVNLDEHSRESYGDFALWKGYSPRDGSVFWESPWGKGRPGWHIECSCMSMKHLGETVDIHCGGEDLIFPHHEDEIAQSEAAIGKPFVRFWLHSAHLLVEGQKMSKSLGNFYTLRDLLGKGFSGQEIRYALLSVHYRLPLNFTLDGLQAARQTLRRLEAWIERLRSVAQETPPPASGGHLYTDFISALDSDLNISEALGRLFEEVRNSNREMDEQSLSPVSAAQLAEDWKKIEQILGIELKAETSIPAEISRLAEEREEARKNRDWKRSDMLRDQMRSQGWMIQDVKGGGYKLTALTPQIQKNRLGGPLE